MAAAPRSVHSYDDLELCVRPRLGPECTSTVESHWLECQTCRDRLPQHIALKRVLQVIGKTKSDGYERSEPRFITGDDAAFQVLHPFSLDRWRVRILDASKHGLGMLAPKPALPGTIEQIRIESIVELADVRHCSRWGDKGFQIRLRLHCGF